MGTSIVSGIIIYYLVCFHGDVFASIFTSDQTVIATAAQYLKGFSIDCIQVGILFCYMGFYNSCSRTKFVFFQDFWDSWVMRVPAAYIFGHMADATLFHLSLATPAATISTIIVCPIYYNIVRKNLFNYPKAAFPP